MVAAVVAQPVSNDSNPIKNPQVVNIDLLHKVRDVLRKLDAQLTELYNKQAVVRWNYATNLTKENMEKKLNLDAATTNALKEISRETNNFPRANLEGENMKRQFKKFGTLGIAMIFAKVRMQNH